MEVEMDLKKIIQELTDLVSSDTVLDEETRQSIFDLIERVNEDPSSENVAALGVVAKSINQTERYTIALQSLSGILMTNT